MSLEKKNRGHCKVREELGREKEREKKREADMMPEESQGPAARSECRGTGRKSKKFRERTP